MDVSRGWFGCAALGGKLYAVGGDDNIGYGGLIFDTVECYDPIDNSWNYIASLNTARDTRAVALGGKLYAVGGSDMGQPASSNKHRRGRSLRSYESK